MGQPFLGEALPRDSPRSKTLFGLGLLEDSLKALVWLGNLWLQDWLFFVSGSLAICSNPTSRELLLCSAPGKGSVFLLKVGGGGVT